MRTVALLQRGGISDVLSASVSRMYIRCSTTARLLNVGKGYRFELGEAPVTCRGHMLRVPGVFATLSSSLIPPSSTMDAYGPLPVGPEEPTPHERACYNKLRLQRFFNTFIGYHQVCFQPTSLHHDPMADFFSRVTSIRAVAGRRATPHCIPACFDSSRTLTSTVRISRRWRREANTLMTRGAKTS